MPALRGPWRTRGGLLRKALLTLSYVATRLTPVANVIVHLADRGPAAVSGGQAPPEGPPPSPRRPGRSYALCRGVVQVDGLSPQELGGPGSRDPAESYERPRLLASRS